MRAPARVAAAAALVFWATALVACGQPGGQSGAQSGGWTAEDLDRRWHAAGEVVATIDRRDPESVRQRLLEVDALISNQTIHRLRLDLINDARGPSPDGWSQTLEGLRLLAGDERAPMSDRVLAHWAVVTAQMHLCIAQGPRFDSWSAAVVTQPERDIEAFFAAVRERDSGLPESHFGRVSSMLHARSDAAALLLASGRPEGALTLYREMIAEVTRFPEHQDSFSLSSLFGREATALVRMGDRPAALAALRRAAAAPQDWRIPVSINVRAVTAATLPAEPGASLGRIDLDMLVAWLEEAPRDPELFSALNSALSTAFQQFDRDRPSEELLDRLVAVYDMLMAPEHQELLAARDRQIAALRPENTSGWRSQMATCLLLHNMYLLALARGDEARAHACASQLIERFPEYHSSESVALWLSGEHRPPRR